MSEEQLNKLFLNIRNAIFRIIQVKQVDIDDLTFNLGISRNEFVENFSKRINDFPFYLQTLSLLENWEG